MSASPAHDSHGAPKKATINGLAVIGFFGLVIAGMLLAVYASRYVPETLSRLSSAVYLSSDSANSGKATTTPTVTTKPTTPVVVTPVATTSTPELPDETGYTPRTTVYNPPRVISSGPKLYGQADLALVDVEVGYLRSGRFIEDDTVPANRDMALRFTVRNSGTNIASGWQVRVSVEGERDAVATGGLLYPNGYQNFELRVTNPREGRNLETEIDVDYRNAVNESNERNNDDSVEVDVDD
ncbi:MAG TPA: CARDB domain-containing protein [Candidatus Paceibacterota bacterium]|nr:CARDB domain-containing protein [Candidatus Paceibacterota bacterium]